MCVVLRTDSAPQRVRRKHAPHSRGVHVHISVLPTRWLCASFVSVRADTAFAVCARAWRPMHRMHVLRACTHTPEINVRYASDVCMLLQRSHSRARARMQVISLWIHTRPMASFMPTHICTSSPKHTFIETYANLASQRCDLVSRSKRLLNACYPLHLRQKHSCRLCGALGTPSTEGRRGLILPQADHVCPHCQVPRAVVHSVKFAEFIDLRPHCPRFPSRPHRAFFLGHQNNILDLLVCCFGIPRRSQSSRASLRRLSCYSNHSPPALAFACTNHKTSARGRLLVHS